MTTISLFTSINYARPKSCAEGTLSTLSNYFYLGGSRATVVKNDEVQLEKGKISWISMALKVASYVLLFPLVLILFTINIGLRYQHNFTIINQSKPRQESNSCSTIQPDEKKDTLHPREEILDTLIRCATKEEDAFLIDFSKVNPSNIFKIFSKPTYTESYGDVAIDDRIIIDESAKFFNNFPFKFDISIVTIEKKDNEFKVSNSYMFTMNDEGKVESYGKVFDNFDLYLEHLIGRRIYSNDKWLSFEHLDFYSVPNKNEYKKLRKKSSVKEEVLTTQEPKEERFVR